jgi:branched-chain amino acid transport system permease protein
VGVAEPPGSPTPISWSGRRQTAREASHPVNYVQILFNGITFGMVLFLISAGLSIVMGVMGITNLAHGALYMWGAYVGWTIAVQLKISFFLAIFVGGLAAGVIGLLIERIFLKRLYKMGNEQVLVTFGFNLILSNLVIWVWGGRFRMQFTAPLLMGTVTIGGTPFSKTRIFLFVAGLIIAALLWWMQDRTRVGAVVRAGMDDKDMIMGLGINLPLVSALVFFGASFLAGAAGVLGSQFIGPNPGMGMDILLLALIVTVVGGVGSIQGALLGGLLIGVIDTFGKAMFPQYGLFTMYLAMIVILLVRPSGLLGRKLAS